MYFMMTCLDPEDAYLAMLDYDCSGDEDPLRDWMAAERFEILPPQPLRLTRAARSKTVLAEMWQVPVPLMTLRLHRALLRAGVANLEVFPAEILGPGPNQANTDYVAFNIVGKIAATRSARNPKEVLVSGPELDEGKIRSALLFRLAESVNAIVVHESVRTTIEASGIDTLTFIEPKDWIG